MVETKRLLSLMAAVALTAALTFGQAERGGISGSVTDSTGGSMAKVKVSATNEATGAVSRAETTQDGLYKIPYLPSGKYSLLMESAGFTPYRVTEIPVLVGQITTIDATLRPGSLQQEISLTANALAVERVSSSLGYVTSAKQIIELPTGRSPYSMLTLSPGVIAVGNAGTGPIVNGGRSNTTAILFDGQDTRNNSTLDNAYTPPQEAVGEVRYLTNSFSAEYGRSAGGGDRSGGGGGGRAGGRQRWQRQVGHRRLTTRSRRDSGPRQNAPQIRGGGAMALAVALGTGCGTLVLDESDPAEGWEEDALGTAEEALNHPD